MRRSTILLLSVLFASVAVPAGARECNQAELKRVRQLSLAIERCDGDSGCVLAAEEKCIAALGRFGCEARLCEVDGGLGAGPTQCTFNTVETASAVIDNVLENQLLPELNDQWPSEAASMGLDPYVTTMEETIPDGCVKFGAIGSLACAGTLGKCEYVKAKFEATATGAADLVFDDLELQSLTTQDLSSFTSGAGDAAPIFSNFNQRPADGTAWNSQRAIVIPATGPGNAITLDLGSSYTLCANNVNCPALEWQGSGDDTYRLETSIDGVTWTTWGDVKPFKGNNNLSTQTAVVLPGTPAARFVRVWAVGTSGSSQQYSVSRIAFFPLPGGAIHPTYGMPARAPRPKITIGPFPVAGSAAYNDPLATVLPSDGPGSAAGIDLGRVVYTRTDGKGNASVQLEASGNDQYRLEYSTDGITWTTWTDVPMRCSCSEIEKTVWPAANVAGRYFRIYHAAGTPGDGKYSVAQLLFQYVLTPDSTEILNANGAATFGPEALATNDEFAPAGTTWNDARYATVLGQGDYLSIDLGKSDGRGIDRVVIQADGNDVYRVEISPDGKTWSLLYTANAVGAGGLQTRDSFDTLVDPSTGHAWTGRYIRVSPYSGDGNYSISEVQIFNDVLVQGCPFDANANAIALGSAQCSYSGDVTAHAALPIADPIHVDVTNIEVFAHCNDGLFGYDLDLLTGSATCTVQPMAVTADVDFCGVSCGQSAQSPFEVTYQQVVSKDVTYDKSCSDDLGATEQTAGADPADLADLAAASSDAIEATVPDFIFSPLEDTQNALLRTLTPFPGETLASGEPAVCTP
jgi:hypothetical protein